MLGQVIEGKVPSCIDLQRPVDHHIRRVLDAIKIADRLLQQSTGREPLHARQDDQSWMYVTAEHQCPKVEGAFRVKNKIFAKSTKGRYEPRPLIARIDDVVAYCYL